MESSAAVLTQTQLYCRNSNEALEALMSPFMITSKVVVRRPHYLQTFAPCYINGSSPYFDMLTETGVSGTVSYASFSGQQMSLLSVVQRPQCSRASSQAHLHAQLSSSYHVSDS